MRFRVVPMQGVAAPPLGDGSCVSAVGEVRGEKGRAPGDASAATGPKTGDCANEGRLFMNCINLESPGKRFPGAVPSDLPDRSPSLLSIGFRTPCGGLPWRIVRAGRPALAPLAKRSGIGNRNRNACPSCQITSRWTGPQQARHRLVPA